MPRRPSGRGGICSCSAWPPSAWSTATSAPRRSTPSASASGPATAPRPNLANVLGVLSLVFWSLVLVVVVKYLVFVMRADNRGEGGIMALIALSRRRREVPRPRTAASPAHPPRPVRHGAPVRRGDDHPGDHRPRRGGGARGRDPGLQAVRGADLARHPGRSVPGPEARHGPGRGDVRAGHGGLVRDDRRARRRRGSCATRRCSRRVAPWHGVRFLARPRAARPLRPRRGGAVLHRHRGAVRRHGALRRAADPLRLVGSGLPVPAAQLLRPGRR